MSDLLRFPEPESPEYEARSASGAARRAAGERADAQADGLPGIDAVMAELDRVLSGKDRLRAVQALEVQEALGEGQFEEFRAAARTHHQLVETELPVGDFNQVIKERLPN